jgi:hypothetical protein
MQTIEPRDDHLHGRQSAQEWVGEHIGHPITQTPPGRTSPDGQSTPPGRVYSNRPGVVCCVMKLLCPSLGGFPSVNRLAPRFEFPVGADFVT